MDAKGGWLKDQIEKYKQQESWVWQPKYTVHTMWKPFLFMGLVMLILALGLLIVQGNYNEIEWDYTNCNCSRTATADPWHSWKDINSEDYLKTKGTFPFKFYM